MVFSFEKRCKNPFLILLAYSDTLVYNYYTNFVLWLFNHFVQTLNHDLSLVLRKLYGVRNQVEQDLRGPHLIYIYDEIVWIEINNYSDTS